MERLLVSRQEDLTLLAKADFWLCLVQTAAEYNQRLLLQQILAKHLPEIREAPLVAAMKDASLRNHSQILQDTIPYLAVSDPTLHADNLF